MQAQQTNIMYVSSKTSPASDMILEDHLKKCISRVSTNPYQPTKAKHQPRMKHSTWPSFSRYCSHT